MEQADMERRNFMRHYFRQDIDDVRHYDVAFSTDYLTARQVADSILVMISSPPRDIESSGQSAGQTRSLKPPESALELR